jgi:two-component system, chemotaxis family, sensor kinase CheA
MRVTMDDLLRDFLTEAGETIDRVDAQLVLFEQDPDNQPILGQIFRLVHTIKGTCGFIGLNRLEQLTHAAESVIGGFSAGRSVTAPAVSRILETIDRIKLILRGLEETGSEPQGDDADLIAALLAIAGECDNAPMPEPMIDTDEILFGKPAVANLVSPRPDPARPVLPHLVPAHPMEVAPAPAPDKAGASAPPAALGEMSAGPASRSIRIGIETIEQLMTTVSELVLTRNQLMEIARRTDDQQFKLPLQRLSTVTAELQESVMKARMQPISGVWQKLPRLVRDLSGELGKDIDIAFHGGETELDRQVLECIKDPLTHLVRNAADHGIEPADVRQAQGKSPRGTIRLCAYHEGGTITIEISDDGRGLDMAAIRSKVLREQLATEAEIERLGEAKLARFIFHPGFSTAHALSHVSGRGVGMDVVRSNIEEIGGTVDVSWKLGHGTVFSIKIPLTLAIVSALIVETCGQRFAIPQLSVVELVRTRPGSDDRVEVINGRSVLRLRDKLLPVGHLSDLLELSAPAALEPQGQGRRGPELPPQGLPVQGLPVQGLPAQTLPAPALADPSQPAQVRLTPAPAPKGFIVVVKVGRSQFGLAVQGVFHTEEIVVKPMSQRLRQIGAFSGTTILGDGNVILILDPNGLAASVGAVQGSPYDATEPAKDKPDRDLANATSLLLFRAGQDTRAIPLSLVARLEEVDVRSIETVGERAMVQYRGELMPVIPADPRSGLQAQGIQPLLVISEGSRSMGLGVDEIVDIVEEPLEISLGAGQPGVVGSAVVRGKATAILDIAHFMLQAHPDWISSTRGKARADAGRRRLLLVDGSPFYRGLLIPMLGAAGYEIVAAADLAQALEINTAAGPFDAVVCDVDAAPEQGLAVLQSLMRQGIQAVATSARPGALAIARARALGLVSVASKFHREALVAALSEPPEIGLGEAA